MLAEQSKLHMLLSPAVEAQGCELLGVQISRGRRHTVLRLFIDTEAGITVEDCERVSHQVSGLLDVDDPLEGAYHLEVSSPGDDRPLFLREHFERVQGERVRVRMAVPVSGRRSFTGELMAVSADEIRVREAEMEWDLPFSQISMARLAPQ